MSGKQRTEWIAPDAAGIALAVDRLRQGALVAVPTETVYGLAARADSETAVAAIYRAKGRPDFNPLIVHVPTLAAAEQLAQFDARAQLLAQHFWPGPLTLVLPRQPDGPVAPAVTAGLPTIALRMPAHPVMRALLEQAAVPLAAPSANRSGAISPTRAQHVADSLPQGFGSILDGGDCAQGVESTIVALRPDAGWTVLRPGPIPGEELAQLLGPGMPRSEAAGIEAPGQLASHYAPGKPVRLRATAAEPDEFLIGFGALAGHSNLSTQGDPAEAAARLYACLHEAAASPFPRIAIAPIPEGGIGAAINDRLQRAAV
ncbi:threonylcarbamoyl-AMP synthase [Altererythrobacter xixiisoli]|uniref:Threonylcarbamoyl-AMP synthase n=1 Tax=Croceibacterium xixiisoli TaxID=1476466 RepID=A0A6I4TQQ4_9SPHN|nr:L-threonylcarbamoyladenylate synthase [Croceibacterium xixiisoli]MXO97421.1 threonylcarbamoyl-AMP synthase [Croceibacterium xixiisoli]